MTVLRRTVLAVVGICLLSVWAVPARAQCCLPDGLTGCSSMNAGSCCSNLCVGDTCVACLDTTQACSANSQCCSNLCTGQTEFSLGTCTCLDVSQACSVNSQCCSNFCQAGVCAPPCQASGQTCSDSSQCCKPNTCGGGGTPGVCGCTPDNSCHGPCGSVTNNCGQRVECGCPGSEKCCNGACVPAGQHCM
jgi:hypothetical protein